MSKPRLGDPFVPMEPVLYPAAFDSPDWAFQVKWDGVRILAHIDSGRVLLFNKRLHERTRQYPEIVRELAESIQAEQAVLDGEVICLVNGKPHFGRVLQRDWATNPASIKNLVGRLPVAFVVFDIVLLNGELLGKRSFEDRQALLREAVGTGKVVFPTDTFNGDGCSLFQAVVARDMEGIVAKQRQSPYLIGKKSDLWRKIKNTKRQCFVAAGCTLQGQRPNALLLGAYLGEALVYVGRVGIGLTEKLIDTLSSRFPRDGSVRSPFAHPPRLRGETIQWFTVFPVVNVEFLEWTDDMKLRHPKIIGFCTSPSSSCVIQ